jgi:hypothetical protein
MTTMTAVRRGCVSALSILMFVAPSWGATQAQKCEKTVAASIASCVASVGARVQKCYLKTGATCPQTDPGIGKQLAKIATKIGSACPDDATVVSAGYGAAATKAGIVARAQDACTGENAALAARTFGGPQGAVLAAADATFTKCLAVAGKEALKLIKKEAIARASCLKKAHGGSTCDQVKTAAKIGATEAAAIGKITPLCANLKTTTGLDPATFVARAAAQSRCVTAAGHGNTSPLDVDCGARPEVPAIARDTWTQIMLDSASSGTLCGDGSQYAFWVKLPPTGQPSQKVAIDLQGGGVCVFESDCANVAANAPGLFKATDDGYPTTGMFSPNVSDNPFALWTQVFLPYCTQDVHIGGGVTDTFPSVTVRRYGAINVRAALRYVRDVLWRDLGDTDAAGYRPDRLTVMFGGESAGGFGVNYNYHYLLDDLRWAHTTAVPDAGLALDNGQTLGVQGLGIIVQGETGPLGWGVKPYQPPYCQATTCAIGPHLQAVHSPRLKAVPEQQIINVSNQIDETQVSTTYFPSDASWINALRTAYCANKGLNGIHNWLPAVSASHTFPNVPAAPYHTILEAQTRWDNVRALGELLPDVLTDAFLTPDDVGDYVDEGTLVSDYPGVNPLGCPGSPSGAFLDQ